MRIAFIGPQNSGKTTLINQFIEQWPMYKRPEKTYRDIIKEKNLPINKSGTPESQKEILNALVDEVQQAVATGDKYLVFDRCVVDNIAYTLWHYAKDTPGFTTEFVIDSKTIAAIGLKYIDVIFYVPSRKEIPVEEKEGRETDEVYREEINNLFESLVASYEKNTGAFFPKEDCPAVIKLDGPPDMRLPQIKLYIKDNGNGYGEEDGSLIDASNVKLDE
jgi:GTPase SAR1 family protein